MKKKQKKVTKSISSVPLEVELVSGTKNCDTCKWFWGDDKPYGPYPSYDFPKKYPEEVLDEYDVKNKKQIKWMNGKTKGLKFVEPAIMSGCRKAPIMTIGINPNLTAFRPGPRNDTWAYPVFSDDASYAYYFRHRTIYQESLPGDFLKKHLSKKEKDRIRAKKSGRLTYSNRSNTSRWMMLTMEYNDKTKETREITWKQDEDYFVSFDTRYNSKFKKGDIIAAKLILGKNLETEVYHNITGYYERFTYVLDRFKKMLEKDAGNKTKQDIKKIKFTIAEDVAQHDMIQCASPGWGDIYDIPKHRIEQNCLRDNNWVVQQVVQSQPKVIVLVGGSSMGMFLKIFGPFTNLETNTKDYFQLIKRTCEQKIYLKIKFGNFSFRSRLICSPHFSYQDNFKKQFRFLAEEWESFQRKFPTDVKKLGKNKNLTMPDPKNHKDKVIFMKGKNPDVKEIVKNLYPDARDQLMGHYYDAFELMSKALKQEYDEKRLEIDFETGHLKRSDGPCHFCDNSLWKFPEGCEYGKPEEKPYPQNYLQDIVQKILRKTNPEGVQKEKDVVASRLKMLE